MGILKNLDKLSVRTTIEQKEEVFDIEANVLLDGEKLSIKKCNCYTNNSIDMNILFAELLRKK